MLKNHMDAKEKTLVALSKEQAHAGHSLHKGTPREIFIKNFLENHLSSNVALGTGEIIDANSRPGQQRNQFDIIIYKRSFPKLDFGANISGFLIESVIATIEVKSTLDKNGLGKAFNAARSAKQLTPNLKNGFSTGYIPPKVLNFIVAYDGPAEMQTVFGWIYKEYQKHGILPKNLPLNPAQRIKTAGDAIDAIFVLKKGFLYFDNRSLLSNSELEVAREQNPSLKWILKNTTNGNLLLFFMLIQQATENIEGRWLNAAPYLSSFVLSDIQWRGHG
ncbi:MAG: hypothetical protein GY757_53100 [bacterium]|nr:hypothetical protein [bacterium]